jgi:hypothetical protein
MRSFLFVWSEAAVAPMDAMLRFGSRDAAFEEAFRQVGYRIIVPRNYEDGFQFVLATYDRFESSTMTRIEDALRALKPYVDNYSQSYGPPALDIGILTRDLALPRYVIFPPSALDLIADIGLELRISLYP